MGVHITIHALGEVDTGYEGDVQTCNICGRRI